VVKPMFIKGESLLSRIICDEDVAVITMARMQSGLPPAVSVHRPGEPKPKPGAQAKPIRSAGMTPKVG
jgi:hypothetical protein